MVIRAGIVGLTEGNGHPFSFSAIVNGYAPAALAASGWPGISEYVRRRDPSEFGLDGLTVTHAWTQDAALTKALCDACRIPNAAAHLKDLLGQVDAVIFARDDHENHLAMAMPFLEAGLPVFIDKPLSLNPDELRAFRPFLETGRLMSCSGMRYAKELDEVRACLPQYGRLKLIRGAVLNDWERYAVHLLEAIFSLVPSHPLSVTALEAEHMSVAIRMDDGCLVQIDALENVPKTFRVDVWGSERASSHDIVDNFSMFRRMLWHFRNSITEGRPAIPVERTLAIMRVLIAGRLARREGRKVHLDDIKL